MLGEDLGERGDSAQDARPCKLRYRRAVVFALGLTATAAAGIARADTPLTAGFQRHIQSVEGGAVDWTEGVLLVHGHGEAEGTDDQNRLLAQRAARLDAVRKAIALANGVRIDATGKIGDLRSGWLHVEGVVKGHREVDVQWVPKHDPPKCQVTLRVPLWGIKGVASAYCEQQRRMATRTGVRRLSLIVDEVDVSESVLVIDARETGLEPCLFPTVQDENGARLYDVARLSNRRAKTQPVVYYVESELSYDELRLGFATERETAPRGTPTIRLACFNGMTLGSPAPRVTTQPTTQPTTKPSKERSRRRSRRRLVVRAVSAAGTQNTTIVLTRDDAERLRRDPEAASLIRNGQVVIVKDSAAAGIEGRRGAGRTDALLALGP